MSLLSLSSGKPATSLAISRQAFSTAVEEIIEFCRAQAPKTSTV